MISIDFSVVVWTIVNFAALMLLLNRFLYKPLLSFMKKRQSRIESGLEARRQALAQQEGEAERQRGLQLERLQEEQALTRSAVSDRRARVKAEREQAAVAAETRRKQAAEALGQERNALLEQLVAYLPALTDALARELLEPVRPEAAFAPVEEARSKPRFADRPSAPVKDDPLVDSMEPRFSRMEKTLEDKLLEPVK